jgi:hypothetical protein
MQVPQVETLLPDIMPFVRTLAGEFESGAIAGWPDMIARVHDFYTPERIDQVDAVVPGWRKMASYVDGYTMVHVTCVLMSLVLNPEYQQASPEQRTLLEWIVLNHDLEKEVYRGQRDFRHGFRSAARTGRNMVHLGLPLYDATALDSWFALTDTAIISTDGRCEIQDNRKLPVILHGIDQIFGKNTPAALIVKTVLFHMSINVVLDWPQIAPLSDQEICTYLDEDIVSLLAIMMSVDNDAYALYDSEEKQKGRAETRAEFARIRAMITAL